MATDFRSLLASEAFRAAERRGLKVVAKTSVTPAITLYDARSTGPSLLDTLGIKAHVSVTDASGAVLAEYGDPAPTELLLVAIYGAAAVMVALAISALVGRGIIALR